jgi:hypothetical protein
MFDTQLESATRLFTDNHSWAHPRAGTIPPHSPGNPSDTPVVVMTLQTVQLTGSDIFSDLYVMRTEDLGKHWTDPVQDPAFRRHLLPDQQTEAVSDFTPAWHAASGKLLGTGHTVIYEGDHIPEVRRRAVSYAFYDAVRKSWTDWRKLALPEEPQFANAGAGSTQRYDLPNGDILLPISYKHPEAVPFSSTVLRCRIENDRLHYIEHGNALSIPVQRGLYEPSVTYCNGRYYLTMRNDLHGYVSVSNDGLHYSDPVPWLWEDGSDLGNYNTQQHWVTQGNHLFLVYTRRGLNNDHVFRHRAPLLIAEVNQESLRVIRSSERILMPNRGARLGNFAVTRVTSREVWVTDSEWMQPKGCEQYGADGTVWVSRILMAPTDI